MTWYPWRFLTSKKTRKKQRFPQAPKINDPFCVCVTLFGMVGWFKRDPFNGWNRDPFGSRSRGTFVQKLIYEVPQAYNFNVYKSSAFFFVVSLKSAVLKQIKFLKKKTPNKTSPRPIHLCFFLFWGGKGWLVFFSEKSWKKNTFRTSIFSRFLGCVQELKFRSQLKIVGFPTSTGSTWWTLDSHHLDVFRKTKPCGNKAVEIGNYGTPPNLDIAHLKNKTVVGRQAFPFGKRSFFWGGSKPAYSKTPHKALFQSTYSLMSTVSCLIRPPNRVKSPNLLTSYCTNYHFPQQARLISI